MLKNCKKLNMYYGNENYKLKFRCSAPTGFLDSQCFFAYFKKNILFSNIYVLMSMMTTKSRQRSNPMKKIMSTETSRYYIFLLSNYTASAILIYLTA